MITTVGPKIADGLGRCTYNSWALHLAEFLSELFYFLVAFHFQIGQALGCASWPEVLQNCCWTLIRDSIESDMCKQRIAVC